MENENKEVLAERFYTLLHWMLAATMPRPAGIHIYSKGAMYRGFITEKTIYGWKMTMSQGVPYSQYAMGFKDDGSRRTPRGPLEKINFNTIDDCIERASTYLNLPIERSIK